MDMNTYLANSVKNNPYLANAYAMAGLDINGNRLQQIPQPQPTPITNYNFGQTQVNPNTPQQPTEQQQIAIMKQYFATMEEYFKTDKGKIAKTKYFDPLDKELSDYVLSVSNPQQTEVKNEISELKRMVVDLAQVINTMKEGKSNATIHATSNNDASAPANIPATNVSTTNGTA